MGVFFEYFFPDCILGSCQEILVRKKFAGAGKRRNQKIDRQESLVGNEFMICFEIVHDSGKIRSRHRGKMPGACAVAVEAVIFYIRVNQNFLIQAVEIIVVGPHLLENLGFFGPLVQLGLEFDIQYRVFGKFE